ncbi:MAG: Hsp33 family molecular chaperone HslO [Gammaproteobacteria bacterium]|nr:Hsp33 family molecular chaperone HslO [Gammaproteobacteria bacterium]
MDNIANTSFSRRFTLENLDIRGQVVRLDDVWRDIMQGRDYPLDVTRYFGELATVAVMVGTGLKHAGRITLQIQGNADKASVAKRAARLAVLDCTHQLGLRGMASSVSDGLEKDSVGFSDWVGNGTLAMTVSNTDSGQQYQSIVPISGLSVAECFEHYFDQSEQLPTHLWLAANAHGAGALMLQKLPNADMRDADGWARVEMLASSVTETELITAPVDVLLQRLFAQEDVRLYSPKPVHSACVRDEEKVRDVLRSLGREELDATIAEYGEVIVKDDMCNQEYRYDAAAIAAGGVGNPCGFWRAERTFWCRCAPGWCSRMT